MFKTPWVVLRPCSFSNKWHQPTLLPVRSAVAHEWHWLREFHSTCRHCPDLPAFMTFSRVFLFLPVPLSCIPHCFEDWVIVFCLTVSVHWVKPKARHAFNLNIASNYTKLHIFPFPLQLVLNQSFSGNCAFLKCSVSPGCGLFHSDVHNSFKLTLYRSTDR